MSGSDYHYYDYTWPNRAKGKIVNMESDCGLPAPYRLVREKERFREVSLSFACN